jgi:hypothetical protein
MPQARDKQSGRFVFNGGDDPESRNTYTNRLYGTWKTIVSRCMNPRDKGFEYYGGAGIALHKPWHNFGTFRADILATIGPKPAGLSLCRIDLAKGFEPGNLQWGKQGEQTRKRKGVKLDIHKVRAIRELAGLLTQQEIAALYDIHQSAISRILAGERWANVK